MPVGGAVGLEEAASSLPAAPRAGARAAVGSWRAASFTPFSHASLVKVDDASFAMGGEGAFACGRAYFASSGAEIEASSLEALRRMVEECDRLQLLHCISDAHGFWGAFSSELALAARDEFAPPAVHAYPIFPPAASASLVEVARSVAEMQATGDGGGCDRYFPLGLALPPPLGALARSPPGGPLLSPGMLACYMETVLAPLLHADGAARTTVLGLEEGIYGSAFDMHQPCDGAAERAAPSPAPPGGARNISVPGAPWCEAWMAGGCTIVECGARRTERAGAADAPPVLAPIYFSGDDGTMLYVGRHPRSSRPTVALTHPLGASRRGRPSPWAACSPPCTPLLRARC